MTAVSKDVYFHVLNDMVDKYNNTYHNTIKMKSIDVKSNSYAECNVDSNQKDPIFKLDDPVKLSKSKNIFAEGYTPNWPEKVLVVKLFEILFHGPIC